MQSSVLFAMVGAIFVLNGFGVLNEWTWSFYAVIGLVFVAIVFAVVSTVWIEKRKKKPHA